MTAFDPKQRLERYETQEFRMPDSVRACFAALLGTPENGRSLMDTASDILRR
jgi:hypothetical protein